MTNLFSLGKTGLSAAQAALSTTGHNIANVNTPGYSRQQVLVSTAGGGRSAIGHYAGRGVQVDMVRRIYDSFLTQQVNVATASTSALETQVTQIGHINNLLADRTVGLAPAINRFFEGINAVASAPHDAASRAELLGRAGSLVTQFTGLNEFFESQREAVNQQIATTVEQINSYAERIQELNVRIVLARGTVNGEQPPNDLLDQRDRLITELNELVGVTATEQDGAVMLTLGNGQVLLGGGTVYPLHAMMSAADPQRTVVAQTLPDGTLVEVDDLTIQGGQLGGLLQFRVEGLDPLQNELGRLAIALAMSFNAQHVQGADLAGQPGENFFSIPDTVTAIAHEANADHSVTFTAKIVDSSKLTVSDYRVTFDGTANTYTVVRLIDGKTVWQGNDLGDAEFDGLALDALPQPPADRDSFLLQPTRHGARDIGLYISDPSRIAASAYDASDPTVGGSSNGENALKLANLQTAQIVGGLETQPPGQGTMSITAAFSQLVNEVGVKTQALTTAHQAQQSLHAQSYAAQQAVSGVNLNEEYINLDLYVQQYQASARLIEVGSVLFDTLLGLRS